MSLSPSVINYKHSDLWVSRVADIAKTFILGKIAPHLGLGSSKKLQITYFLYTTIDSPKAVYL